MSSPRNRGFLLLATAFLPLLVCGPIAAAYAPAARHGQVVKLPNTPAGAKVAGWLAVFNSGDDGKMRSFIAQQFAGESLEKAPASLRTLFQKSRYYETRGYAVRHLEESSPYRVRILAQGNLTGLWYRITLRTEAAAPYAITEYSAVRISRPPQAHSIGRLSAAAVATEAGEFVNRLVREDIFSGVVLVAKDGTPILKRACGDASKTYNSPNQVDTKFNLASVNKMFTAVAVAQLLEKGKVSLTDTISRHLPDYPDKEVAGKVTVHHLLTHTSGLGDIYNEKFYLKRDQFRSVRDYFPLFAGEPLAFEPGKGELYSNAGYIVLGAIIAAASGEDYFRYVGEHIFRPAGMIHSGYYELDRIVPKIATGYTNKTPEGGVDLKERRILLYNEGVRGNPAGHGYSTADDLLRFCNAFRRHRLLGRAYTDLVTSVQSFREDPEDMYGYGFQIAQINGSRVVGHTGGGYGGMAMVDMYLDEGYTVIVLSNYQRGGNLVAYKLRDLLTQKGR
jgi:CubicO group peptidase (beta-lactamase class C family)